MKPPIKPIKPAVYIEGPLMFTLPPAKTLSLQRYFKSKLAYSERE
jgi:hypothetical protein